MDPKFVDMNPNLKEVSGNAMFVVNIGDYLSINSRESFEAACKKWDCDYVECKINPLQYNPNVIKFKAFDLCPHERILVLDADTIIREGTPNLFERSNPDYFYAVKNEQVYAPEGANANNARIARINIERILAKKTLKTPVDVEFISENFFNGGMFIISREHEEVLALAFYLFLNVHQDYWHSQIPLNLAVFSILGNYRSFEPTYNRQFPEKFDKMTDCIYHLASLENRKAKADEINWRID